jgi:phage portal protein BeeE
LDWSGTGRFYGKPPLAALAVHADLENTILSRLYHEFKNFAPPGLHYETDAELTRDQVNDIFNQIVNQHSLSEQTGLPIVTHSGLKAKEFTSGRREISYLESLNYLLEFTLAVYGVPKAVVGLVADTNRANMMAALMAFCENTINPLLVSIAQVLTRDIAAQFDERCIVKFDPCSVEDAQRIREDILVASRVGAVTPNEVREVLLGKGPYNVGGNKPYIMAGMLEAAMGNGQPVAEKYEQEAREVEGEQDEECDLFEIANGKVQIKNRDRFRDYFARQGLANGSNFISNGKNGL